MEKNKYYKISNFIIDKKYVFVVLFVVISIVSIFTMSLTEVEDDLLSYLDEDSLTKTGLNVMENEFEEANISAKLMIENIELEKANEIYKSIQEKEGVLSVIFNDTETNFKEDNALYNITFDTNVSEEALSSIENIKSDLDDFKVSINSSIYTGDIEGLNDDMVVILVIVVVLILLIVTFTSKSFAEIPVLLIVFAVAAIINMGTNFIFGEISFISNAVAVILQLALAIDYALIFIHRFAEEREQLEPIEACKEALSKAMPEIASSSLTTIFSLIALAFMTYNMGADLSKVLIKSIVISLLAVFTLMPALIVIFSKLIDKTKHKNFVPNIEKIGKISIKSRYVVLPIFLVITVGACIFSYKTNYEFYEDGASGEYKEQIANIESVFGVSNNIVVLVSKGNELKEVEYVEELKSMEHVTSVISFNSIEILEGITLQTSMPYKVASKVLGVEEELGYGIYASYANYSKDFENFEKSSEDYSINVYDLMYFIYENIDNESMDLDEEIKSGIMYQVAQIEMLEESLETENFSRIILDIDLEIEEEQTFELIEELQNITETHFDESYLIGNSINSYELSNAFNIDNRLISGLSILFIAIILICTFKSVLTSFSMILVIQSAIYINFAFPYIQGIGLYFIGYLIVAAIQMGANIDYAIVITNRYKKLCETMDFKEAIIKALNEAFPTIITSGSILAIAGIVLYNVTSNVIISTLGLCIGRGTLISMILVLFVLPQLLYVETQIRNKLKKNK